MTFYVGYDPTGPSLHVGHLLTLVMVQHLVAAGHRALLLIGGGTARIGDPTGKSEMRPEMHGAQIDANAAAIGTQLTQILRASRKQVEVVNNASWLADVRYLDFLREIGRHFSVNRMLTADAYRERMKTGLSFIEFNYQLLQAYDFLTLYRSQECLLQLGGDDQWSNILAGVELCRRLEGAQVMGVTCPLLTTASGSKMGKTASGAIWLDAERTSIFDFFQFWINVDDADVPRFLRLFTRLSLEDIDKAEKTHLGEKLRQLKRVLAFEVTALVHGEAAAKKAHRAAASAFGLGELAANLLPQSKVDREGASGEAPQFAAPAALFGDRGYPLVDLLVDASLVKSKNEARRMIEQGGVRLNDDVLRDVQHRVTVETLRIKTAILWAGKKRARRLTVTDVDKI